MARFWNFILGCIIIAGINVVSLIAIAPYSPSGSMSGTVLLPIRLLAPGLVKADTSPCLAGGNDWQVTFAVAGFWGLGTILGAALAANLTRSFSVRWPTRGQASRSLAGGMLMGVGLGAMSGCNVAHLGMFARLVPASIFVLSGITIGAFVGFKLVSWLMGRSNGG